MPKLILSSSSPRVAGLRGTLTIEPIGVDRVAELLAARAADIVSLLSYQSTCDVLATLAGLRGIHRRTTREPVDLTLATGDHYLVVALRTDSAGKAQEALGAVDFTYTLCEYSERAARGRPATIDRAEIVRRLAAGETQAAIAQAMGCTQALVSQVKTANEAG